MPTGLLAGDILLLFLETANQAITIANSNGGTWTALADSPQGTGTAGGTSATSLTVFWSQYNGLQTAPVTSDSGDHQNGVICAWRGATLTGNPWDVTSGGVESSSDTSWSITGDTTTVANTLVVIAGARMNDSSSAHFSSWTNSDLTSVAERADGGSTGGNGGGIGVAEGQKAAAGSYVASAVTNGTATVKGFITIALKPPLVPSVTTNTASSITDTAATLNGDITSTGGISATTRGFSYGTDPTLATVIETTVETGLFGTGTFSTGISSLTCNTTYYFRAYATNIAGSGTGSILSFTTSACNSPPTLSILQPDGTGDTVYVGDSYNITYTLADSDDAVTAAFYYDTDASGLDGTVISGSCATAGEGAGATCTWDTTGITPGSYYVYGITNDGINGNVSAYSTGQITINTAAVVSVTITTSGVINYGTLAAGASSNTIPANTQTAKNDGTVTETINIKGQDTACPWTLFASTGNEQYTHEFSINGGADWSPLTTSYQTLETGVVVNGTKDFDLRVTTPSTTACYSQQAVDITIQAVAE